MTSERVDEDTNVRRTRLDSGLRVVTEHLPGLRSAAVGFWVGTGSRDEPEEIAGSSHFLEHLLFKGSADRHAAEIAEAVESCGGDMNAFTGQELTAYYVRVPDRHLHVGLDILSDIVWSPALRPDEIEGLTHVDLPTHEDYDTLGGLVLRELGRIPSPGDAVEVPLPVRVDDDGEPHDPEVARLTVVRMDGLRVDKVRLQVLPGAHGAPGGRRG